MPGSVRVWARIAVGCAAAAGLGLSAWAGIAPATADPVGPADPMVPVPAAPGPPPPAVPVPVPVLPAEAVPPAPAPTSMLGQFTQIGKSNPVGAFTDVLANSPQPPVIGLSPVPPETVSSGPGADPLTLAMLLMPQNYRVPAADQTSPYPLAPNVAPSPFARIDAWKGMYALTHGGLGRMPGDQLGQPLPGITPPAGSNPPPGLEQFYPGPGVPPDAMQPIEPPIEPPITLPQPAPPPG